MDERVIVIDRDYLSSTSSLPASNNLTTYNTAQYSLAGIHTMSRVEGLNRPLLHRLLHHHDHLTDQLRSTCSFCRPCTGSLGAVGTSSA